MVSRISNRLHEHQAEFKACLSKKEQLERKYDTDVKRLLEVTKKQEAIIRLVCTGLYSTKFLKDVNFMDFKDLHQKSI